VVGTNAASMLSAIDYQLRVGSGQGESAPTEPLRRTSRLIRAPGEGYICQGSTFGQVLKQRNAERLAPLQQQPQSLLPRLRVRGREPLFFGGFNAGKASTMPRANLFPRPHGPSPPPAIGHSLAQTCWHLQYAQSHAAYYKSMASDPGRHAEYLSTAIKKLRPKTVGDVGGSSNFLSEVHLAVCRAKYSCTLAAPGMTMRGLHFRVDDNRVLCISNSASPAAREVLGYIVDVEQGVRIYAHPSLNSPAVGHRAYGARLRGYAPVHFWVALLQGEGWIHVAPAPGQLRSPVSALGRPPLATSELTSEHGFARYFVLPPDADVSTAEARMERGFFVVDFERTPPPEPEEPEAAVEVEAEVETEVETETGGEAGEAMPVQAQLANAPPNSPEEFRHGSQR